MTVSTTHRSRRKYILLAILCGSYTFFMALFTVTDLQINLALYCPGNLFSEVFYYLGPLPMLVFGIFSSVSFLLMSSDYSGTLKAWRMIYGVFALLYFSFMGNASLAYTMPLLLFASIPACFLIFIFSLRAGRRLLSSDVKPQFTRAVCTMLIACTAAVMGVDVLKIVFGRLRFAGLSDPLMQFRPWYVIQSHHINSGFPSGHASRSALLFCCFLIPSFRPKSIFGRRRLLFLILFIAFTGCSCISRILAGEHYATDIITGLFITLLVFVLRMRPEPFVDPAR